MEPAQVTLEQLFSFLPELEELEELRLFIIGAAVPDPDRAWDGPLAHTIDKRIVSLAGIGQVVDDAERALHDQVTSLFTSFRPLLQALGTGRDAEAAHHLIGMGEQLEGSGRLRKAKRCFETALSISLPLVDKAPQILALRRMGRVALALGELQEALLCYQRSRDLARDDRDLRGQVIAQTGCGNVLAVQGRWKEAEECYRHALDYADAATSLALDLERAQLFNNLGMVAMRQDRLSEAEEWFRQARELWARQRSPVDLAICLHNQAQLREKQGEREQGRSLYRDALELPIPPAVRATIAIDLAESYLSDAQLSQAETWGREAEEQAIAAHSPYCLAHMYRGLGNIARAAGDDNGFVFFEKALEIARAKRYPLVEGETLVDYAHLRAHMGEVEEAQAYLEHARALFGELGAVREQRRADTALRELMDDGGSGSGAPG